MLGEKVHPEGVHSVWFHFSDTLEMTVTDVETRLAVPGG